ncbi:MAG: plastocyanin/azurin family copper-binding protein, partial [Conexivisphaerales archaeon]
KKLIINFLIVLMRKSNMQQKNLILALALIAIVAFSSVVYVFYYLPYVNYQRSVSYYNKQLQYSGYSYGGMMGFYNGYAAGYQQTVSISKAITMMRTAPSYVKAFSNNGTLVFNSSKIVLVVLSMGNKRAVNLTGQSPPSYAQHDVFVIYGLINPTLVIPRGATVDFILINLDDDMYHNIAITPVPPPYQYYAMMQIMMNVLGITPFLPPANYSNAFAYGSTFSSSFYNSGTYYYVCEYPGHAEMGMYGQIVVD